MSATENDSASAYDYLKSLPLYLLPHHLLSRIVLCATRWQFKPWKNWLIRWFSNRFCVSLAEAVEQNPCGYKHFNSFFTRPLRSEARLIDPDKQTITSPVDGAISQIGNINNGRIFQAKGRDFSLQELLGGDEKLTTKFASGSFATLYLAPKDYHRIHIPTDGRLTKTVYVPGRLFSVAPHTTRTIPRLFARNERLITIFETDHGPMAAILVGAIFVACIETVWGGIATPPHGASIYTQDYPLHPDQTIELHKGDELGRFNMGSTVILLFGKDRIAWDSHLAAGAALRMGQAIGHTTSL